jgi:Arc/MetJ-type ribon-helix-helix transcriptional regulator
VRTARATAPATHFLGVRLTTEEESLLERFRAEHELPNRSEAVRALVRSATELPAAGVELPATLRNELEELVEDGFASDLGSAVTLLVTHGIRELVRTHDEDLPALRSIARTARDRRAGRKRADREGRGFLRR